MASSITWSVPMDQLTADNYNFYIYGMTAAAAEATIAVKDPNGKTWNFKTKNCTSNQKVGDEIVYLGHPDIIKGGVFNFPNPVSLKRNQDNPQQALVQPYGWTIPKTAKPYTFEITISSSSGGSNEGIAITATNDDAKSVMSVVQYNDPSNSDKDYNDVVLNLAFFPDEPYGK